MSLDNRRKPLVHPNLQLQKRWELDIDNRRALAHRENIQTRTGLIPKSFNNIPGFAQFAYNTVATAWLHSVGSENYLDSLEHDLTETVMSNDVDHKFSPAAITNAAMTIMADKEQVTQHFMKVAPHGPEVESMYPIKLTDLRATWEVEYVN